MSAASLTAARGRDSGWHQVLLDDKTFYQATSADRITEWLARMMSGAKSVSQIGAAVM
jgi:hypothetical protein